MVRDGADNIHMVSLLQSDFIFKFGIFFIRVCHGFKSKMVKQLLKDLYNSSLMLNF